MILIKDLTLWNTEMVKYVTMQLEAYEPKLGRGIKKRWGQGLMLIQSWEVSVSASASRASAKQMMSQYLLNSQTVWEVFLPFLGTNDLFLKLTYEYVEISLQQ